ncbi:hypothetical protein BLNAU_16505 [Blattamonas nauphoetae]|uniref:Uncharacterized protein n=1 Tax=Blattamonas nauphoetae TaxID=2049346 RepID=A0ABQ9X8A0_9EUKA|nr:hypothetical protein BLNAU_16505 [Blattamonas nauphoetae]
MMTILDECFDSHTPIANKRLLHSSHSQLSQSPSLDPKIKRTIEYCFVALNNADESSFVLVEKDTLDSVEMKDHTIEEQKQQLDAQGMKLSESERKTAQLEGEKAEWTEERMTHLSTIQSLQKEKAQTQQENEQLRSELTSKTQNLEHVRRAEGLKQTIQQMKTEVARKKPILASDVIVALFLNPTM